MFTNTIWPESHLALPSSSSSGRVFDLMTEWEDLYCAVNLCWSPASASASEATPVPASLPAVEPMQYFKALRYAFETYRAAVVVSIRSNRLVMFLPFANDRGYRNQMGDSWKVRRDYASWKRSEQGARSEESILRDPSRWWFNGHMVCNVRPDNVWGEYQLVELFEMISKALAVEGVNLGDADFLLNKRDCPLWFRNVPSSTLLPFHLPVLSPYTSDRVNDVPMVLADDWRIATKGLGFEVPPWETRKDSRAIFRGSSTGMGITVDTNARMKLCLFALDHPVQLDCKITRINDRDQLILTDVSGELTVCPPRIPDLRSRLHQVMGPYVSLEEQSKRNKLAIYIRGHQAASRLGALLASGFCVVYYAPENESWEAPGCDPWFKHLLVDWQGWRTNSHEQQPTQFPQFPQPTQPTQPTQFPQADPLTLRLLGLLGSRKRSHRGSTNSIHSFLNPETPVPSVAQPSASPSAPRSTASRSTAPQSTAPQSTGWSSNVCFVKTFEEMVDCVRFLQTHDDTSRHISQNALELSRTKIHNREFILRHVGESIKHCHVPFLQTTHALFGATNQGMLAASRRVENVKEIGM